MSRLTRDGTAEPVTRDQLLRHERGQVNIPFPCSAEYEQNWQPYPVDPYFCYMCACVTIHKYSIISIYINGTVPFFLLQGAVYLLYCIDNMYYCTNIDTS